MKQPIVTLADIATALGMACEGDAALEIDGVAEPALAGPRQIALAMDQKFAGDLAKGAARAAILWAGADWRALGLEGAILVERGADAMVGVTRFLDPGPDIAPGIHPSAVIHASAEIGEGAAIAPFVVIGRDVQIGPGARIASHVSIAEGAQIGAGALIHAGARIGAMSVIGDNFICQPNACIGGDGFAFKTLGGASAVEKARAGVGGGDVEPVEGSSHWGRVHSLGNVVIGDDVEVGSNTSIDRGTIRATSIGRGTKIDNQVQIGHNCQIGEDCLIAGSTGLAGSVRMGNRVVLGGQVGVSDNLFIGDDVIAGGRTTIFSNVPAGRAIWGTPAVRMETQIAINKDMRRLPRLAEALRALQKAVSKPGQNE